MEPPDAKDLPPANTDSASPQAESQNLAPQTSSSASPKKGQPYNPPPNLPPLRKPQPGAGRPKTPAAQDLENKPAKDSASQKKAKKEQAGSLPPKPPSSWKSIWPSKPKPPQPPPKRGLFYQLGVVIAVAGLVATLFTAWTPGSSWPEPPPMEDQPIAFQPTPTLLGAPTATPRTTPLIGIVAGHWQHDSGAVCDEGLPTELTEESVNLTIAALVQKMLSEQGYDAELISEFDPKLQGYQATALVSIHNDSCQFINAQATGFKVAAAWATRNPDNAARLTACLRNRYAQITNLPLHSTSVTPDMSSYHAFEEIDAITPAVIIETGFMNLDREFLTKTPDKAAQGIVAGIQCYLKNESISNGPSSPTATGAIPQPSLVPTLSSSTSVPPGPQSTP